MKLLVTFLFALLTAQSAFASHGACTKWERRIGYSCVFNGRTTPEWVRQCFHKWDNTLACMAQDPNTLTDPCTKWVRAEDVQTCSNGIHWERRWIRGCVEQLLNEEFCSDTIDPNTIGHKPLQPVSENDPTRNPNEQPHRRP